MEFGHPNPLSRKRVSWPPSPRTKGGEHTRFRVREVGESQFGRLEKKLGTLSTLCFNLYTRYGISKKAPWVRCVHKTFWKLTKEGSANSSVYLLISRRVILLAGLHTNFTLVKKKGSCQIKLARECREFEGTAIYIYIGAYLQPLEHPLFFETYTVLPDFFWFLDLRNWFIVLNIALQAELFLKVCTYLVTVIIIIYFAFLIGVFFLLQVFWALYSDLKSEKTTSTFHP